MSRSPAISQHSFLIDAFGIAVDKSGTPVDSEALTDSFVAACTGEAIASGMPSIRQSESSQTNTPAGDPSRVAMAVPVYRGDVIVSIMVLIAKADPEVTGVLEWWQPIGEYDELNLSKGYFGGLERFQNVSSFVRFEKGSGLPGQVWRDLCFTIHDSLPSHPGFLRAAGASAGSLEIAIGLPVRSSEFLGTAVMISADATPIAQAYEVWRCGTGDLVLESAANQRLHDKLVLPVGASIAAQGSLPGKALELGQVVTSSDPAVVFAGRSEFPSDDCHAMAIPFFEDDRVTNILTLIF